jgi:hypothetical protein
MQTPRGIDDDDITAALFGCINGIYGYINRF